MSRNLDRRVEILFPVEDEDCMQRVEEIIDLQLKDTERSHIMLSDASYKPTDRRGKVVLDSMKEQQRLAIERADEDDDVHRIRRFVPKTPPDAGEVDKVTIGSGDYAHGATADDYYDEKLYDKEVIDALEDDEFESGVLPSSMTDHAYIDDLSD